MSRACTPLISCQVVRSPYLDDLLCPFNLASGDFLAAPPLISNCFGPPFGIQGKSWRLESCLPERGDQRAPTPGALQGPTLFQAHALLTETPKSQLIAEQSSTKTCQKLPKMISYIQRKLGGHSSLQKEGNSRNRKLKSSEDPLCTPEIFSRELIKCMHAQEQEWKNSRRAEPELP